MKLSDIHLVGFRNFKNCTVKFSEKTLIIGSNDVGKSNLLYAIRLLLDKTLSEADIMPVETDFFAYEDTREFKITVHFTDIQSDVDDCVISHFKGDISEDGELYLQFVGTKDDAKGIDYKIQTGGALTDLTERDSRYYLRRLNLEYLSSYRDLKSYIKKEQKTILEEAKEQRTDEEVESDTKNKEELEGSLTAVTHKVKDFSYIKSATKKFNTELGKLSAENKARNISFDAGATDADKFINNLTLVSQKNGKYLTPGGDGRNNQIFLSMWASRKQRTESEIKFYAIEEPEAHLHPHQQRNLSRYLTQNAQGQIIITSHSPQIASEFSPDSIVRLFESGLETKAAKDGCSQEISDATIEFAHRMSILPAETFFSDAVILVEGVSEVIFFKAFAKSISKDLDHHNISILSVEGIGFKPYINLLLELEIPFCMRTDNDCIGVPKKTGEYRNAGLERVMTARQMIQKGDVEEEIEAQYEAVYYQSSNVQDPKVNKFYKENGFEQLGLFLAEKDLETDLINSPLKETIFKFTEAEDDEAALGKMTKEKGVHMFEFIRQHAAELSALENTDFVLPINHCLKIVSDRGDGIGKQEPSAQGAAPAQPPAPPPMPAAAPAQPPAPPPMPAAAPAQPPAPPPMPATTPVQAPFSPEDGDSPPRDSE